jgi:competence protein ComFB
MTIHNNTEDLVIAVVNNICDTLEKEAGKTTDICTCDQCRLDAVCYVLNRVAPNYIVSNRGAARTGQETLEWQQKKADITALAYEGILRVSHNLRPSHKSITGTAAAAGKFVYNIPVIMGRLFNGLNFAPMADVEIDLYSDNELAVMKDQNWQNPYKLVANTQGMYTFWPTPIKAKALDETHTFEFSLRIEAEGLETLCHFFKIPVLSEIQSALPFSMERTYKIADLFMFPPSDDEEE